MYVPVTDVLRVKRAQEKLSLVVFVNNDASISVATVQNRTGRGSVCSLACTSASKASWVHNRRSHQQARPGPRGRGGAVLAELSDMEYSNVAIKPINSRIAGGYMPRGPRKGRLSGHARRKYHTWRALICTPG